MKASSYTSSFLTADDVKTPRLVNISAVNEEKVGQDTKLVLYADHDGDEVKVALNKSNINRLIELFGTDETDDWTGEYVVIFRDANVMFNNRKVGGIAFRKPKADAKLPSPPVKSNSAPEPESAVDDDLPF